MSRSQSQTAPPSGNPFENSFITKFQRLAKRNSFLYVGLPMMTSIVAGSFLLARFQEVRMEVRDETYKHHRNEEELGIKTSGKVHRSKNKKTLEEELKAVEEKTGKNEDDWDFKRVTSRSKAWEEE